MKNNAMPMGKTGNIDQNLLRYFLSSMAIMKFKTWLWFLNIYPSKENYHQMVLDTWLYDWYVCVSNEMGRQRGHMRSYIDNCTYKYYSPFIFI